MPNVSGKPSLREQLASCPDVVRDRVSEVVTVLAAQTSDGLILGGSRTLDHRAVPGDFDFWLVVDDPSAQKRNLLHAFESLTTPRYVHDAGFFPWLGELITVVFFADARLSVDVGLCTLVTLSDANPGPAPIIVWGDARKLRRRLKPQLYDDAVERRLGRLFINCLKVRKNVERKHLWDATECLMKARREFMGLVVDRVKTPRIRYSRPERGIEDIVTQDTLDALATTAAELNDAAIARALGNLVNHVAAFLSETTYDGDWAARLITLSIWARAYEQAHHLCPGVEIRS